MFAVARDMACVPIAAVADGLRVVDAEVSLPPATTTRLQRCRETGSVRVLVDAISPDRAQWVVDGPWTHVGRAHDEAAATAVAGALDGAEAEGAHVLILPELALDPVSVGYLRDELRHRRARHPTLVVTGITHQPSEQRPPLVVNEAVVLDGRGRELLRHRKLVAFGAADGSGGLTEERLEPGDTISVLTTPVGNLSLLICKDLFADRPEPALRVGWITWLLVPSLSRSTGPHRDRAHQLRPRWITTVVCNAWDDEPTRRTAGPHLSLPARPCDRPRARSGGGSSTYPCDQLSQVIHPTIDQP